MSRLAEDIDLLQRAADIAGRAIWTEHDNVMVPPETLEVLGAELSRAQLRIAEYRLIDDEAVWLLKAAQHVVFARLDDNPTALLRWTRIAELLRAAVATDLHSAKQSLGERA